MTTTTQKPTKFLFVNKDEGSASLSNSRYDKESAINQHVQKWRTQRRRHSRRLLQPSTSRSLSNVDLSLKVKLSPSTLPSKPTTPLVTPSEESSITLEPQASISSSTLDSSDDAPTDSGESDGEHDSKAERLPFLFQANFEEGDAVDPFNTTAIRLDGNIQSILQYYLAFSVPSKERNFNQTRTRSNTWRLDEVLPAVKEVVHGCLFNKTHMYALLTATSARMEEVSHVNLRRKNSARWFMNKALKHVRGYLESKSDIAMDKQIILDIFYLMVCEWYLQDYDAALTHMKAVGKLLRTLDSKSPFDQFIWETVRYNDIFLSVETATPPLFPLTWDGAMPAERRSFISQQLESLKSYRRMGRGFTDPAQNWIFSFEMNTIIFELVPWMDVAQYTWRFRAADRRDSEWVCSKGQALLHRLLSCAAPDLQALHTSAKSRYEECCRLILIICVSYTTTQMAWRSAPMNLARLKIALHGIDRSWDSVALDCMLLWILLTAAFIGENTENEAWFLERAEHVARNLKITTYDQIHELMSQYFYSCRMEQGTLRKLLSRLGSEEEAYLSYIKAPPLDPHHSYRQRFGYNLASTPGQNLCRKGHWEATSTLSCLAEYLSEDGDFAAIQISRSHSLSPQEPVKRKDRQG